MADEDMIRQGLQEADAGDLADWDAVKAELEEWSRKRNESDERKVNAKLMDIARRNPPPAEWYDSPEEECPFVEDGMVDGLQEFARELKAATIIYGGQLHCPRCGDRRAHDAVDHGDRIRWLCRECGHASYTVQRDVAGDG